MTGGVAPPTTRWSRGWLLALMPAGFAFGLISGFLQEHRISVGSVEIPWAAILVVVALVATIRALSLNMETKLAGALFYAGWLIATALLALPNPSGDIVFTDDVGSLGYLLAGTVLGAAAAVWPLFLDAAPAAPAAPSAPAAPAGPAGPAPQADGDAAGV